VQTCLNTHMSLPHTPSIFEKIIKREISADIVYEDADFIVIADIKPIQPGHVLVIPKTPFPDFVSADAVTIAEGSKLCQKIARGLLKLPKVKGINVITNNGAAAGQSVFHLHWHVIPRHEGDNFPMWHGSAESASLQAETCAYLKKILIDE